MHRILRAEPPVKRIWVGQNVGIEQMIETQAGDR